MKKELTQEEIERRFAKINARTPERLTEEEASSLAAAQAMDDGTTVNMEEFMRDLDAYSGKLVVRIPRSLHKALKEAAEVEGVSLNQYMLYKLSR